MLSLPTVKWNHGSFGSLPDAARRGINARSMPVAVNLEKHWRALSANIRAQAARMNDPQMRAVMVKIADSYDRLADRAREVSNKETP